jgi:hypothetical protein
MFIVRHYLDHTMSTHYDHRNTIREAITLVKPLGVKSKAVVKSEGRLFDDFNLLIEEQVINCCECVSLLS